MLLQGAFDILNYGRIRAFKFAKAQGDYLIVALNTNEFIRGYKNREPVMAWSQKRRIIEACRYAIPWRLDVGHQGSVAERASR